MENPGIDALMTEQTKTLAMRFIYDEDHIINDFLDKCPSGRYCTVKYSGAWGRDCSLRHLIHTLNNILCLSQLASKFTCIFGYHFLNSTCPKIFLWKTFRLRIQEIHPETSIFYNTITILYAIKVLQHLIHPHIKYNPLPSFLYSRDLFIYTFNTDFYLKCFCCFINVVFHSLFCFSVFLGT